MKIVLTFIMMEDGGVLEFRGWATLRMCGQVWVGMRDRKLDEHGGECMISLLLSAL